MPATMSRRKSLGLANNGGRSLRATRLFPIPEETGHSSNFPPISEFTFNTHSMYKGPGVAVYGCTLRSAPTSSVTHSPAPLVGKFKSRTITLHSSGLSPTNGHGLSAVPKRRIGMQMDDKCLPPKLLGMVGDHECRTLMELERVRGFTNTDKRSKYLTRTKAIYRLFSYTSSHNVLKRQYIIIMDRSYMSLHDLARKHSRISCPSVVGAITFQLFDALDYLNRGVGILHMDIKSANVMLTKRAELRLIDFGLSHGLGGYKAFNYVADNFSYICTRNYRPYDMIYLCTGGFRTVDVWSACCTLVETFTGRVMFDKYNDYDLLVHSMFECCSPIDQYMAHALSTGKKKALKIAAQRSSKEVVNTISMTIGANESRSVRDDSPATYNSSPLDIITRRISQLPDPIMFVPLTVHTVEEARVQRVKNARRWFEIRFPALHNGLRDLILSVLTADFRHRPTARVLLDTPYMQQVKEQLPRLLMGCSLLLCTEDDD